jgi:putative hemolysin
MITTILFIQCAGLLILLIFSAFFSSSETCLFSLNSLQLEQLKSRAPAAGQRVENLLNQPNKLLSTILIGNTIVNVASASLGYSILDTLQIEHAAMIAIPSMTVMLLIFGEVVPKRIAMKYSQRMAAAYAGLLVVFIKVLMPLRWALEKSASVFAKNLKTPDKSLSEDEFLTVVEVGEEEGVLDEEERTMVDGIIRLEETQASDVMTPRVDLIGIDLTDSPEEQEKVARSCLYRYLPLYRETLDHIEGFLDVPRFLLSENHSITKASIEAFFVPETAPLDTLLATFQKDNRRVAVVSDEYGGTAGLITRGDILEEIAEDVDNEFGKEDLTIQQVGDNRWFVDGSVSLEDINYELDMHLKADGADRIAGWVASQAEHIPRPGEVVEAQDCRATVQIVRRQRIMSVMIEKTITPDQIEEDNP